MRGRTVTVGMTVINGVSVPFTGDVGVGVTFGVWEHPNSESTPPLIANRNSETNPSFLAGDKARFVWHALLTDITRDHC